MDDFAGKRVVVMGLGRFGGGAGAARWLADRNADVLVTDLAPESDLADSLRQIQDVIDDGRVRLRLGAHNEDDFRSADGVVVSPAVPRPWENRYIKIAVDRGARITTEIRLLVERLPNRARTIGVTGTAGKSTTTAMIAHILRNQSRERQRAVATASNDGRDARPTGQQRIWLGGNIGGSLLPRVHEMSPDDWVVLELSSAMLYWLSDRFVGRKDEAGWSPHIAVLMNVMPNHLDWHGDFAHYAQCKESLKSFQRSDDHFIDARDCARVQFNAILRTPGAHNRGNARAACMAAKLATGDELGALMNAVSDFVGLPHRLQLVAEIEREGGVIRAYNDSKCTTPEATALAIHALEDLTNQRSKTGGTGVSTVRTQRANPIHLIAGGYDKGMDLDPMVAAAARCKAVYTIGVTGPRIAAAVREAGGTAIECGFLEEAIKQIADAVEPGDAILLSPGCASWDQFTNYEERGGRFTHLVRTEFGLAPAPECLFQMPNEDEPEQNTSENYPNKS